MKNKGLFILAVGYLTGVLVASKFVKKDKKVKFKNNFDELKSDVIQVHKDFFKYLNENIVTEDNKKILNDYKEKIYKEVEDFRSDSEKYIEELKEKGITKKSEIEKELAKIYEKRMDYIEKIKKQAGSLYSEVKDIIVDIIDESKEEIEKTYKDTKKKMEK